MLFAKFAAFYGHVWRSQFKDENFFKFAKKEWAEGLSEFSDAVLDKAILNCRENCELPPTLPQIIISCRQTKRHNEFYVADDRKTPANLAVVSAHMQRCREILTQ